jgi:hypothetical protein
MLDDWEAQLRERVSPEDLQLVDRRMERDRNRFQGTAAAVIVVTAEPTRAEELAREKGEQCTPLQSLSESH